ncbi:hypothetical protein NDA01_21160 [Trichocoleus desertorum AS-A10]|uniref:hypothetical protein n=1 Tax=Trichocoleus desertorum TaxID=1481672 RepID=UPI00329993CE
MSALGLRYNPIAQLPSSRCNFLGRLGRSLDSDSTDSTISVPLLLLSPLAWKATLSS